MRSLVTGGAGFIGAHVASELLRLGHEVVVLDDLSGGYRDNVPEGCTFVLGSILDTELLARLFAEHRFDFVYHLAAYAAEGLSHFIKRFNYTNNLIGSVNLVNESVRHRVRCFVFTSSIAVYGTVPPPMREDAVAVPEDPYGIAKLAVEQELRVTAHMFRLPFVIFRPHNVYGEYQNIGDRYRNVVGIFMNQLLQGRPLTVFGDGGQTRAFSYVGDVAPVIARAAELEAAHGEVFNIGADEAYSVKDLATAVMAAMGVSMPLRHLPAREEVVHAYADHSKVERVFGKVPGTPLAAGLGRMAAWVRQVGARSTAAFAEIELREGLPAVWLEE